MKRSLHQESSQHTLVLQQRLSKHGEIMEQSRLKKLKEDIDDIFTPSPIQQALKKRDSFTAECLQLNKNMILKDKLMLSRVCIPPLKLSKTLDQESISKEEALSPFWIKSLEETYMKLWSPIETDLQDLDLNYSSSCSNVLESFLPSCQIQTSKSLLQNLQKTSYQSLRFSQQDIMDQEPIRYCKKIRFYPTKVQSNFLNQCIGGSRFFYNKAVSILNDDCKGMLYLPKLRKVIMTSDKDILEGDPLEWQKQIPYDTRQEAIADAISAFKGCLTKMKNNQIKSFKLSFRTKKAPNQICKVNKKTLDPQNFSFFPNKLKKNKHFRLRKRDIEKFMDSGTLDGNFVILKTQTKHWYFCLPRTREQPVYNNPIYKSVFLDPGVRTFQTFYSPDGICGKIDKPEGIQDLANRHDKLMSIIDKSDTTLKTKKSLKKRCAKLREKLKNKIDNFHWQTCSFLCKTFQNIFIPIFQVSKMVKGSPLGSKITRAMLQLSHGKFRERLLYYGKMKNRNVYIVKEDYTTKTCGNCGHQQEMGAKKVFKCEICSFEIDRDLNAARNICLKLINQFI